MTRQQELELLADWLGIDAGPMKGRPANIFYTGRGSYMPQVWNPLTNDTDFLNMVTGRVDFIQYTSGIEATICQFSVHESYKDHNNDKLAAMKHAAYQVCLMAAREWKESAR